MFREWKIQLTLGISLLLTMILPRNLLWLEAKKIIQHSSERYARWINIILLSIILFVLVWYYNKETNVFVEMVWPSYNEEAFPLWFLSPSGSWYFVISCLTGYLVYRFRKHGNSIKEGKIIWYGLGACLFFLLYFFSVLSFSYGVYHFIPAGKGGGDFTKTSLIKLHLSQCNNSWTPEYLYHGDTEKEFILIDGTNASVFVANPMDKGGPINWRRNRRNRPSVIEIPRSEIMAIEYINKQAVS